MYQPIIRSFFTTECCRVKRVFVPKVVTQPKVEADKEVKGDESTKINALLNLGLGEYGSDDGNPLLFLGVSL